LLREVISRRLGRLVSENGRLADIILVDGGKTQESAALRIVEDLELEDIRIISLAKERNNVYFRGRILKLDKESEAFKLIKRITDEAHRFAHSYHVKRRDKKDLS